MKRLLIAVIACVSLGTLALLGVLAWRELAPLDGPPGQPPVVRVRARDAAELARRFDADSAQRRLLVLLSPT